MSEANPSVKPWDFGDPVVVQIPAGDCFDTFTGVVVGFSENGEVEVTRRGRQETVMCRPEWVYPEDFLEC